MARLSRAQAQQRNRAKVLAAAREEFLDRGYRDAKIDTIAERAELTRGAVYSNFPGKRALYLTVLAEVTEQAAPSPHAEPGRTARAALGALARAWVARLPLPDDDGSDPGQGALARLGRDLVPELLGDERVRLPFTQLLKLDALLLALALERLRPPEAPPGGPSARLVRLAETVLTTLYGARQLAVAAPGFVEPFDVVSACELLADLALNDWWAPPPASPPTQQAAQAWSPPGAVDLVRGEPAPLTGDGVVAVLGLHRAGAIEQAVRGAPPDADLTAVLVTGAPAEFAPLARLVVADLCGCLRQAFPRSAWPRLRVVCDASGAVAAAAGVRVVSDVTETAVRIVAGRIVARADGTGACHAVASGDVGKAGRAGDVGTGGRAGDVGTGGRGHLQTT